MINLQDKLDYAEAVADWFIDMGKSQCLNGCLEESLRYTHIAANILSRQNRILTSDRIEQNLRLVAERLETGMNKAVTTKRKRSKITCLHVLNEIPRAGGLIAMALRWVKNDQSDRRHSLAVLTRETHLPPYLKEVFTDTTGNIYLTESETSLKDKSLWLRGLSREIADYIILHVGTDDVICGAAFGIKGGPPVLIVNHAAHTFWTGSSVVDLVVNCRGSLLEKTWTKKYRGIDRCKTIPIPLHKKSMYKGPQIQVISSKSSARVSLGIPDFAFVMISVGAFYKYMPIRGCDFLSIFKSLLEELPNAYLLCVGFNADKRWDKTAKRLQNRIRCLGFLSQAELANVHKAADIYIEGFPFGTTTALLEAGLNGIPVVLAPSICPPPYSTDGVSLDNIVYRASTIEKYKNNIIDLAKNEDRRIFESHEIEAAVSMHHTGIGWKTHLENALQGIPLNHSIYTYNSCEQTPIMLHEYWADFVDRWGVSYDDTLEHHLYLSVLYQLPICISNSIYNKLNKYRVFKTKNKVSLLIIKLFFNIFLPLIPFKFALVISRALLFLCRPSLIARISNRLKKFFMREEDRRDWYGEYRKSGNR